MLGFYPVSGFSDSRFDPPPKIDRREAGVANSLSIDRATRTSRFHGLTTQLPWQVWIAMPRGSHVPPLEYPPIKMVQFTGEAYSQGIESHERDGVTLHVYSVAKTVADCFKHRNKIGIDVALEALKDARAQGKASFDDLWRCAKVCRVSNVMRPYLEAVA